MSRVRHHNLDRLTGFCVESDNHFLVYEYCSNGNLKDHLLSKLLTFLVPVLSLLIIYLCSLVGKGLTMFIRVKILRDCALALKFLHSHPDGGIVHEAIKLSNILLNNNMEVKLSNLGLAKMLDSKDQPTVSVDLDSSSIGYMDPEDMTTEDGNLTHFGRTLFFYLFMAFSCLPRRGLHILQNTIND
ncbi:hypothetical protein Sjap_021972 [Stephania japonica]|uniref:Protein kinase domain-containing protein n=1 Tax=Stephania japonica TaxID=461633 RepID=A0AAP0EN10_9MAGN